MHVEYLPDRGRLASLSIAAGAAIAAVDPHDLIAPSRGKAVSAFARQTAMYLAHVGFQLSLTRVGRAFGRDRTTVRHGCALIEEARDDIRFDQALDAVEAAMRKFEQALRQWVGEAGGAL
jgi:chromosomal replication initiation ATPase DnaA